MQAAPGLGRAKLIPTWEVRFPSLLRPGRSHATCPFRPPRKNHGRFTGGHPSWQGGRGHLAASPGREVQS